MPHFHAEGAWNPLIGHHEHHMSLRYFFVPKLKFRLNWYILPILMVFSKMLYGWFQGCLQFWMKIYSNGIWRICLSREASDSFFSFLKFEVNSHVLFDNLDNFQYRFNTNNSFLRLLHPILLNSVRWRLTFFLQNENIIATG